MPLRDRMVTRLPKAAKAKLSQEFLEELVVGSKLAIALDTREQLPKVGRCNVVHR
jgi:hypothetical protein